MRSRISAAARRGCLAVVACGAAVLVPGGGAAVAGTPGRAALPGLPAAFAWFAPGPAPTSFRYYHAVQNTVVVADPPKLKPLGGSDGSLSFAARGKGGAYFAFLDVTPQQGAESLTGWAAFRLALLRTDGATQIHEDAAANNLPFIGGTGACVIDDYVTQVGHKPFHEIACFVEGPHTGSVVVVATPPKSWASYAVALERVISAYRVT